MINIIESVLGEENDIYLTDPQEVDLYGVPPLTVRWYKNIKWGGFPLLRCLTVSTLDGHLVHVEEGYHPPCDDHDFVECSSREQFCHLIDVAINNGE